MKKLIFTSGLIISILTSNAQFHGDNFDGNWPGIGYQELVYDFDTTHGLNIWQIGQPQKTVFNQAYSLPNVLITDTINFYPINDTSIIMVKAPVYAHDWGAHTIMFYYKLNTDTLSDFGKLEVSADNGLTFINVLTQWDDYGFWWNGDIHENFTGNTNDWNWFSICISSLLDSFPTADTIQYRFTFISDGNQTNKDGWIIDDLVIQDVTESIDNVNLNLGNICYPNPTSDYLTIEYKSFKNNKFRLELYDGNGKFINMQVFDNRLINIDLDGYESGVYFYRIIDEKNNFQTYNKFIINK
ncbi:MAG: T9SS type A sorting domain-containing protein [Chlorobi bacterium]|nr:T9SS type A sorting domain-containing protein [Chlorobiota bacterium]